jgi:protein ImuA
MHGISGLADCSEGAKTANVERLAALQKAVGTLRAIPAAALPKPVSAGLGPSLASDLPGPGLPCGVLNEVTAGEADRPAAFGFLAGLMAAALRTRAGPAVFVAARRALDFGRPYGQGLRQLGLDVGRLILVETENDKDALWALEEPLRSGARPAMVAGVVGRDLDLTQSRRLNLAAAIHTTPLVVVHGTKAAGTSAAATRWRLAATPAAFDRFGAFDRCRWQATLERCRNGRTGQWLLQWNAETHRFERLEDLPAADAGLHARCLRLSA